MATVNLSPSGTSANDWTVVGGSTAHEVLSDTSDSSAVRTQDQNDRVVLTLDDFDNTRVLSIDSIRHYIRGFKHNTSGGDVDVQVKIQDSGAGDLYSETHHLLFNSYVPQDYYGTVRTTSTVPGVAWTDGDLDGLILEINTTPEDPDGVSYANVVKAYVEVTYTLASADNAIFFGTNF